ncbi:hypothetical protein GWI33_020788 [Rhynchophorus ferrugineus]|uniref:Uncharacterized protein n=1 Tax=Rhynchophorus ferrugineus TaxID=354439 RepID=A0A834HVM9_RHYFE|nr:hypothetical protein GWI33_020788 [Rhynchophorus ferrugineus]
MKLIKANAFINPQKPSFQNPLPGNKYKKIASKLRFNPITGRCLLQIPTETLQNVLGKPLAILFLLVATTMTATIAIAIAAPAEGTGLASIQQERD